MFLKKLDIQGVRNIRQAVLSPASGINLVCGENGSGKTSLLEAIYLLSRGRSFRTRNLKAIINTTVERCTVFCLLADRNAPGQRETPLGVTRDALGGFQFKISGRHIRTASELAETLPVLMMNSDSIGLIEGGPGSRRKFLDWGVFHVEHGFRDAWRNFQRCHKQRNYLLRRGSISMPQLSVWDREFALLSEQVADYRQRYFERLEPASCQVLAALSGVESLDLRLFRGWSPNSTMLEALERDRARDLQAGMTHSGAHRADLKLRCDGRPASEVLSRGQAKLVVLALLIAQGQILGGVAGRTCVYLLDDLAAELDYTHLAGGMELLADMGAQVFITGTNKKTLQGVLPKSSVGQTALFHVEQGVVKQENSELA